MNENLDPAKLLHRAVDGIEPADRLEEVRAAGVGTPEHRSGPRWSALAAAAAVAAILGATITVAVAYRDDQAIDVATEAPSDGPPSAPEGTRPPGGLVVGPSGGLTSGDAVRFRLQPPVTGRLMVTQCPIEVVGEGNDPSALLDLCRPPVTDPAGNRFTVSSTVPTRRGSVDCTTARGRCVLLVRPGGVDSADQRWAPLTFAPTADPEEGALRLLDRVPAAGFSDGQRISVRVTGFAAGSSVQVQQCRLSRGPDEGVTETGSEITSNCDQATGVARDPVELSGDGEVTLSVRLWADMFNGRRWQACDPCGLRVGQGEGTRATIRVPMDDAPGTRRPSLHVTSPGPHRPGQTVRLEGSGFRRPGELSLAWCRTPPGPSERTAHRTPDCEWPSGSVTVSSDGTLEAELSLPAPGNRLWEACTARPGACGFASGNAYSSFFAPFDITT